MGVTDSFTPTPEVQKTLLEFLGSKVHSSGLFHKDFFIQVHADHLIEVVEALRTHPELKFDWFIDLCGVDYLKREPRFEVVVHLQSMEKNHRLRLRVLVPDSSLTVPSLTRFWKAANWQEREAFDMYGIRFEGHPNLTRILSAPDVQTFPQRKDYPLHGEWDEPEDL